MQALDSVLSDNAATECRESADQFLEHASREYSKNWQPVDVSFRTLLHELRYGDRATHFLHPYPGKLVAHIPYFFLRASQFASRQVQVLDPFCGSGTTLVESLIRGVAADGFDVNPFAVLLSSAKCALHKREELLDTADEVVRRMPTAEATPRDVQNHKLWYEPKTYTSLLRLRSSIDDVSTGSLRDVMLIALSITARTLSLADPRLPVPVRVRPGSAKSEPLRALFSSVQERARSGNAAAVFFNAAMQAAARYEKLSSLVLRPEARVRCASASILSQDHAAWANPNGSYDLVVTSPPYCGAQKYVRSTSHALAWTCDVPADSLAELEAKTIGREHIRRGRGKRIELSFNNPAAEAFVSRVLAQNEARAWICAAYISELDQALANIARALRQDGHIVMVVGENKIARETFPAVELFCASLEREGLERLAVLRDAIPSRGLMTKRNAASAPMSHEHVIIMRKRRRVHNA